MTLYDTLTQLKKLEEEKRKKLVSTLKEFFNPESNGGKNIWSSPAAVKLGEFQTKTEPIVRPLMKTIGEGIVAQGKMTAYTNPLISNKQLEKYGVTQPTMDDTLKMVKGNLALYGAGKAPLATMGAGVFNAGIQAVTNKVQGKPVTENLSQAAGEGMEFGAILGSTEALASTVLKPLTKLINPVEVQNINKYLNLAKNAATSETRKEFYKLASKRIIQNVSSKTISSALGMGLYGATLPANTVEERLTNMLETGEQGALFGAATSLGGYGLQAASNIKLGNRKGSAKLPFGNVSIKGNSEAATVEPLGSNPFPRGFIETVSKSKETSLGLKEGLAEIPSQNYVPKKNNVLLEQAKKAIRESPDDVKKMVMDSGTATDQKIASGIELAKHYQAQGNLDSAVEIINHLDRQLRESGRAVQAANLWNNLGPQGMVRAGIKAAAEVNQVLPKEVEKTILKKMEEIQALPETERLAKTQEIMGYIADNIPASWKEKLGTSFDAYRYTNMLSGPQTHERNVYQNLLNTFITRPADLAFQATIDFAKHPFTPLARDVSFADVPKYYKNISISVPDAVVAAKEAFKGNFTDKFLDDVQRGSSAILENRKNKMIPKPLKVIPGALEAQDKFFSTLISTGEYNRMLSHGVSEAEAKTAATKLAEEYLVKTKLGDSKSNPLFVRALDSLGQLMEKMRKLPVIGEPAKWFIPFVKTPVNVAKMMVQHSPLGAVGGDLNSKQMAQATTGAVAMAWGAMMASKGDVTWAAPTDEKQKNLFYASGRQPYSVKIGGAWVPMWYFGPWALSIGIPAAVRDAYEESKTATTDDQLEKITHVISGALKFLGSQTPMQGTAGFFRMLDGDLDYKSGGLAAGMASQAIPLESLVRWVNGFVDPVFRKGSSFVQNIEKGLPIASKTLEPYRNPPLDWKDEGEVSTKETMNQFLPYKITSPDARFEQGYKDRTKELQKNAEIAEQKREGTYKTEAQLKYEEYKKLKASNPDAAYKMYMEIKNDPENPNLFSQINRLAKDETTGTTDLERKLREMPLEQRATIMAEEIKQYPKGSAERKKLLDRWRATGILTDDVNNLLLSWQKEGKI